MPVKDSGATLQTFWTSFCGWGLGYEAHLPRNSPSSSCISLLCHLHPSALCFAFAFISSHYEIWRSWRQRLFLNTLQYTACCLSEIRTDICNCVYVSSQAYYLSKGKGGWCAQTEFCANIILIKVWEKNCFIFFVKK